MSDTPFTYTQVLYIPRVHVFHFLLPWDLSLIPRKWRMAQFMLWGGQNRKTLTQVESDWQKGNLITHHKRNTTAVVIYDLKVGNISKAKLRQKDVNCYFISYWQSATINIFLSFLVTYHSLLFLVSFCLFVFLIYFVIVWSFLVILMHSLILHYGWRQPLSVNEKNHNIFGFFVLDMRC